MQTRRQFMIRGGKLVAAAAAATAAGPTVFTRDVHAAGQLKILLWNHFVPAYDAWFDDEFRFRQLQMEMDAAGQAVTMEMQASDWGEPVDIKAPAASEIVEVRLSGVSAALLFGVTSRRASPETTAPLCYAGTINSSELLPKGKWGVSLFVQASDSGFPESANVVETAIGAAALVTDCSFDVV